MNASISPPPFPPTDGVITLRQRREDDFGAVRAGLSDAAVRRWMTDPIIEDDSPCAAVARVDAQWRAGIGTPFVIANASTASALGLINLRFAAMTQPAASTDESAAARTTSDRGRHALVAYSVFATARGRGVAPRAVRLVAAWAFAELDIDRLVLEADLGNEASIRVAEKCRFTRIGDRDEVDDAGQVSTMAVFELRAGDQPPDTQPRAASAAR